MKGRPPLLAFDDKVVDKVTAWRSKGISWNDIARLLNVHPRTLARWRDDGNYQDPRNTPLTPEELDEKVLQCVVNHPERGERIINGILEGQCTYVTRSNLRASMHRVDPEGVEGRKSKPIKRRVYSVEGPHHLWHIDGNHKLIRFHIVIYAGMDGFSRALMFIGASNNNRSETVLNLFTEATKTYGIPSRIRIAFFLESTKI